MLAAPLAPQPGWERVAGAIQRHAQAVLGVEVPVTGVPLYTDARHYAARGIPVVLYGAGPRTLLEANAHNADENLRLERSARRAPRSWRWRWRSCAALDRVRMRKIAVLTPPPA